VISELNHGRGPDDMIEHITRRRHNNIIESDHAALTSGQSDARLSKSWLGEGDVAGDRSDPDHQEASVREHRTRRHRRDRFIENLFPVVAR
jgi:hypothetical protein